MLTNSKGLDKPQITRIARIKIRGIRVIRGLFSVCQIDNPHQMTIRLLARSATDLILAARNPLQIKGATQGKARAPNAHEGRHDRCASSPETIQRTDTALYELSTGAALAD